MGMQKTGARAPRGGRYAQTFRKVGDWHCGYPGLILAKGLAGGATFAGTCQHSVTFRAIYGLEKVMKGVARCRRSIREAEVSVRAD